MKTNKNSSISASLFGGAAVTFVVAILLMASGQANAVIYGGIEFPDGEQSFADEVLRYEPLYGGGPGPTDPCFTDPNEALGPPDFPGGGGGVPGAVSLGRGGLIELLFVDNRLTNSGDDQNDLHIFEVGPDVEDTFVAIRPTPDTNDLLGPAFDADGDGFYEVGKVFGATSSIDIDAFFPGFGPGELLFDAVQLIDDPNEGGNTGSTVGADIDAVGAIQSEPAAIEVAADIKPRSCPNPLNLKSKGVLPVAILGSEDFDANDIDPASVRLKYNDNGEGVAPIRSSLEDVTAPVADGNECECNEEGPDGYTDLTLKFSTPEIALQVLTADGELEQGKELRLDLTGELNDGTPIEGSDCVVLVGKLPDSTEAMIADINKDGRVNGPDFLLLKKHWYKSTDY
ncbi:MAG: hypothetical protein ACYTEQ_16015 [Planctomycetota bacterium]|jgi:hypothetical protein